MASTPVNAMSKPGGKAPAFVLPGWISDRVRLSDLKGQAVVLYFYPKDNTPGCTTEAQAFRDHHAKILAQGAVVLGVSPDSVASHEKFAAKQGLEFELLADTDHAVAERYGVWVEKRNYGRTYMGIQRATFLIDAAGRIAKVWPKVRVKGHAEEVLAALAAA